ncbi:hypothetical protein VTK56DRAFT_6124 [Thermocarpiscus australiensis]
MPMIRTSQTYYGHIMSLGRRGLSSGRAVLAVSAVSRACGSVSVLARRLLRQKDGQPAEKEGVSDQKLDLCSERRHDDASPRGTPFTW